MVRLSIRHGNCSRYFYQVGLLNYNGKDLMINDGKIGAFSQKLYDTITGIQYGEIEDKYNWNYHINF